LVYHHTPITDATRFVLPVWCWRSRRGIYHDYRADYLHDDALDALIVAHPSGFTYPDAEASGVARDQVEMWYREGYVVPIPPE
jgi:hypothetical protein